MKYVKDETNFLSVFNSVLYRKINWKPTLMTFMPVYLIMWKIMVFTEWRLHQTIVLEYYVM